jgi:hypothetical protein
MNIVDSVCTVPGCGKEFKWLPGTPRWCPEHRKTNGQAVEQVSDNAVPIGAAQVTEEAIVSVLPPHTSNT